MKEDRGGPPFNASIKVEQKKSVSYEQCPYSLRDFVCWLQGLIRTKLQEFQDAVTEYLSHQQFLQDANNKATDVLLSSRRSMENCASAFSTPIERLPVNPSSPEPSTNSAIMIQVTRAQLSCQNRDKVSLVGAFDYVAPSGNGREAGLDTEKESQPTIDTNQL